MVKVGVHQSRRLARRLGGVKCPWCRCRVLSWDRKAQVVRCGSCLREHALEDVAPSEAHYIESLAAR